MKKDTFDILIEGRMPYCVYFKGVCIAKFLCKRDAFNFSRFKEYFDLEVEDEKKKC